MPEPFEGSKERFGTWKVTIEYILETDQDFIGGNREKCIVIWNNLTANVQTKVAPWYEKGGPSHNYDPDQFLDYLSFHYRDAHERERALAQIESIRQKKNESFADFFVRFSGLLGRCGGDEWDDAQKLTRLRRSLNDDIRTIALNRGIAKTDYQMAVSDYQQIASDMETSALEEKARRNQVPIPQGSAPKKDQDGDVDMVTVSALKTTRAGGTGRKTGKDGNNKNDPDSNWIPDEIFQQRKKAGVCTRCGQKGHKFRKCPNALVTRAIPINAVAITEEEVLEGNE